MELIDMELPLQMTNYASTLGSCVFKIIILAIFSQYLAVSIPLFAIALYYLQRFYLQTSRQVRVLGIEAKGPLYTHFIESVAGGSTIRAFGWQTHYQQRNCQLIDTYQRPEYIQRCIQNWLALVLDIIVTILAVVLVTIIITWRDRFSAGSVGVSLVMVTGFNSTLARLITSWTTMESSIGAVARVKRFVAETEAEKHGGLPGVAVPSEWPKEGSLEFANVVASYR